MALFLYILSALLFFRGIYLIMRMTMIWISLVMSVEPYDKKVNGKVVGLETRENPNPIDADIQVPIVEYSLEEEGQAKIQQKLICNKILRVGNITTLVFPRSFAVGDRVRVCYKSENVEDLFVHPTWTRLKLIVTELIPGLFFIISSVLGIIYAVSH